MYPCIVTMDDGILALLRCLHYSQSVWNLDVLLHPHLADVVHPQILQLTGKAFKETSVVTTWSIFPEGTSRSVMKICGLQ